MHYFCVRHTDVGIGDVIPEAFICLALQPLPVFVLGENVGIFRVTSISNFVNGLLSRKDLFKAAHGRSPTRASFLYSTAKITNQCVKLLI